jgi:hypothetical protein
MPFSLPEGLHSARVEDLALELARAQDPFDPWRIIAGQQCTPPGIVATLILTVHQPS